jgi:signal peptidase I
MLTRRENRELAKASKPRRSIFARFVTWVAGSVVLAIALGFVGTMIAMGTAMPFTATVGHSMNPLLFEGDLALIRATNPNKIQVGDVVRLNITANSQKQFGLPSTLLHRVAAIRNSDIGLMFTTKGDNNPQNDTFETRADNITGIMVAHYRGLGYVLLMTQSPSAPLLGEVALALIAAYLLIAWLESAMNAAKAREKVLKDLVEEIPDLKSQIKLLTNRLSPPEPTYVSYFEEPQDG